MKIEIGCGKNIAPGFKGVDIDASLNPDFVADMRRLPFADGTIEEIRAVHCIEHIPWQEVSAALREWARVLHPEGRIFLATPSLRFIIDKYLDGSWTKDFDIFQPGEKAFCSIDGRPSRDKWVNFKLFSSQVGQDKHCACYSADWLCAEMQAAGFRVLKWSEAPSLEITAAREGSPTDAASSPDVLATAPAEGCCAVGQKDRGSSLREDLEQLVRLLPALSARRGRAAWLKRILLQLMRPFARPQIEFDAQLLRLLDRLTAFEEQIQSLQSALEAQKAALRQLKQGSPQS